MYIRTMENEIYLVAKNVGDARIGDVVVKKIEGVNYYVPKADVKYNNVDEEFCIYTPDSSSMDILVEGTTVNWEMNIPDDISDIEAFKVDNCTVIDDADLGSLIKQNSYEKMGTPIVYSDEDIFAPEITSSDNFLCAAIKKALAKKNVPMKLYDSQFGKEHNKNNSIKAIRSGKVTDKKFTQLCETFGLEYAIILFDKDGVQHPMNEPIIHATRGFEANDMMVDLIKAMKK